MRSIAACLCLLALPAHAGDALVLPLVVHVAEREGKPVVPDGFVAERVLRANEIYAPYGVRFEVGKALALGAEHAALEKRADRDALAAHAESGAIHCFVVASLRDVDDPSQMRRGVHWRSRTRGVAHNGAHYVIISAISGPNVLAHELGHFLGNREHSAVAGNLMSYTPGTGLPVLDAAQQARMHAQIAAYLESGELKALK